MIKIPKDIADLLERNNCVVLDARRNKHLVITLRLPSGKERKLVTSLSMSDSRRGLRNVQKTIKKLDESPEERSA